MQYFNTWSFGPWETSTEHLPPNPDLGMTIENQRSSEAETTKVMADHDEEMDDTNFMETRISGARSHIKANDLRNDPVLKVFLQDLLEETVEDFHETSIDTKNAANGTLEVALNLRRDFQDIKASYAVLASSQRETQEILAALMNSQQELRNQVHALKQDITQFKSPRKRAADQISGTSEEDIGAFTAEIGKQKNHIAQIEKELDEKREECVYINNSHQEALNEIEQLRSTGQLFSTIDDDAVISQWKELKFAISNLTRQRLSRPNKNVPRNYSRKKYFSPVSRHYLYFLGERDYVALVFQGVIWHFLSSHILKRPGKMWGVPLGNAIDGSFRGMLLIP